MKQELINPNNAGFRITLVALAVVGLSGCFHNDDDDEPMVNNPPTAMSINIATETEQAVTENFPASDTEQDALSFTIDTEPTLGSVTVNADGSFTYQPFAELTGNDSFSFTAMDSDGRSATATVGILINALQVPFTQFARGAFSADAMSAPQLINGREFIQDGLNTSDYQDLIDNN